MESLAKPFPAVKAARSRTWSPIGTPGRGLELDFVLILRHNRISSALNLQVSCYPHAKGNIGQAEVRIWRNSKPRLQRGHVESYARTSTPVLPLLQFIVNIPSSEPCHTSTEVIQHRHLPPESVYSAYAGNPYLHFNVLHGNRMRVLWAKAMVSC